MLIKICFLCYLGEESAVEALIAQFYHWEGCAKIAEKRTNAILDGEKDENSGNVAYKSNEEFIEETVAKCVFKNSFSIYNFFVSSTSKSRHTYGVHLPGFLHCYVDWFLDYGQQGISN